MDVAVHHCGHELNRVVRLQPRGLVADHGIGGGVGFVETVVGELVQQVPNLNRLRLINPILTRTFQELRAFNIHRLLQLLTHRAAQQVRAAKRVSRHLLRDLHHLFLINDDALGLVEDMVDGRVQFFTIRQPVLHLTELRNILHRTGAIQRHQRNDILDTIGLHASERIHHPRAFHLEHRNRLGARVQLITRRIIQRDRVDLVLPPACRLIDTCAIRRFV